MSKCDDLRVPRAASIYLSAAVDDSPQAFLLAVKDIYDANWPAAPKVVDSKEEPHDKGCPYHPDDPFGKIKVEEQDGEQELPERPVSHASMGLLDTLYSKKAEAYINALEARLATLREPSKGLDSLSTRESVLREALKAVELWRTKDHYEALERNAQKGRYRGFAAGIDAAEGAIANLILKEKGELPVENEAKSVDSLSPEEPTRENDKPPSHWKEADGWVRHPQTAEEWNWHDDPIGQRDHRTELRVNFAMDLADPNAPDQMALILRIDLMRITARMHIAEARAKAWHPNKRAVVEAEFKNFHRSLCVRFGYNHDETDWKRDQVSLEEHIASLLAKGSPSEGTGEI